MATGHLTGVITDIADLGIAVEYFVRVNSDLELKSRAAAPLALQIGDVCRIELAPGAVRVWAVECPSDGAPDGSEWALARDFDADVGRLDHRIGPHARSELQLVCGLSGDQGHEPMLPGLHFDLGRHLVLGHPGDDAGENDCGPTGCALECVWVRLPTPRRSGPSLHR